MASPQWLLVPLFIHVLLVLYVGSRIVIGRIASVKSGETRLKEIALDTSKWPVKVRKLGNNFSNQFEVPMLWYALCGLLVATGKIDLVQVSLSWLFIATRLVHSFIHTGRNIVPQRMYAFLAGFVVLLVMWTWFALRLYVLDPT
jgi:hypothetical protein